MIEHPNMPPAEQWTGRQFGCVAWLRAGALASTWSGYHYDGSVVGAP
jgi:hypothetical protein